MKVKALFPISVSNQLFSTEIVVPALTSMPAGYDEYILLVADRLTLYNAAMKIDGHEALAKIIENYKYNGSIIKQRKIWLQKIKRKVNDVNPNLAWKILGVDDIADSRCFRIFRNVILAFHTIKKFRSDIVSSAKIVVGNKQNVIDTESAINLSIAYILEEIALSIRLRVVSNIEDEFYLGVYHQPIVDLYNDLYEVDVYSLAEMKRKKTRFRFFRLLMPVESSHWSWQLENSISR